MSEKLEIYPREAGSFYAIPFTGEETPGLLQALEDMDLALTEESDGKWFIDGDMSVDDTAEIEAGQYYVRCGPYWSVCSLEELQEDFRLG